MLSKVIRQNLQKRFLPLALTLASVPPLALAAPSNALALAAFPLAAGLSLLGLHDMLQKRHAILRNYPILGHLRFLLEEIRPEIRQYFFESENDGAPFSRARRAIVYQRAKRALDTRPFGTQADLYAPGHEWLAHALQPVAVAQQALRVTIGGPHCSQPYNASILNISAMSYGALSANAIRALNQGAVLGSFAHDSGEGGISPYHQEAGGDLIWEIGSGYFGCRTPQGRFAEAPFRAMASQPQIRMIEVKLSQGAKPGHGGVLPAAKVTPEIAEIRGVPLGRDCISPAAHSEFSTPQELLDFIARLRQLSGGKPVGFKLCLGRKQDFIAIAKAMATSGAGPDFIVIDGAEGGTGAAPAEFVDNLGMPLREGLHFAHATLVAAGVRDKLKLGCAGKIITGFDMACALALGADWCNMARGFMFALGCIQAQSCHTGRCPTGIATQDAARQRAVDVPSKAERVAHFHQQTLHALAELLAAAGCASPQELTPAAIARRMGDGSIKTLAELYPTPKPGALLRGEAPPEMQKLWDSTPASGFSKAA